MPTSPYAAVKDFAALNFRICRQDRTCVTEARTAVSTVGDTVVNTSGVLLEAFNFGQADRSVNGVTFVGQTGYRSHNRDQRARRSISGKARGQLLGDAGLNATKIEALFASGAAGELSAESK